MNKLINCRTARLYQAGHELDEAVKRGANANLFMQYDEKYKGGSIPYHDLHGTKPTKPYSCEYHTGGVYGEALRQGASSRRDHQ
ncbi:hypothetical protein V5085_10640 [Moellerella wisconsensis]|uniref:hypothetical protein n=1 Tax=Moellerella wisconsensis TaxID=158849 RepID=UPI0030762756